MSKIISLSKPAQTNNEQLLTVEDIRAISGCEDFTDEQAAATIETIVTFATVIVNNLFTNSAPLENQRSLPIIQHSKAA